VTSCPFWPASNARAVPQPPAPKYVIRAMSA
jgi:hypothetical protein